MSEDLEMGQYPRRQGMPLAPPGVSRADPAPAVVTDELPRIPNPVVQFLELIETCIEDPPGLAHFQAELDKYPLDITAGPGIFENRTPLHLASLHGKLGIVKLIMASPGISAQVVNAKDDLGYTPLHLAVPSQPVERVELVKRVDIVRLLTSSSLTSRSIATPSDPNPDDDEDDYGGSTPLHLAAMVGNIAIAKLLLDCQDKRVLLHATNWNGMTALDIAKEEGHVELWELLECSDVTWLDQERQKNANSVNAILVGAALVLTMTFPCLLTPPLFILDQYNASSSSDPPAPAPSPNAPVASLYATHASFFRLIAPLFLMLVVLSFACAVASLLTGISAVIPFSDTSLRRQVKYLRYSVWLASSFLYASICSLALAYNIGTGVLYAVVVTARTYFLGFSIVALILLLGVAVLFVVGRIKVAWKELTESEEYENILMSFMSMLWVVTPFFFLFVALMFQYNVHS